MDAHALERQIEEDLEQGYRPWLLVASAGTTNVGAVDPLNAIADIADRYRLWLHVDAAYGGAFALCEEGRQRLSGLARSNSLVLDPHKGFFIPCGVGVVLVRDGRTLFDAFAARGEYMQDVAEDSERSACDVSPELTRPFRALRFWLPLRVHGTDAFAAALEEKLLLARYFYDQVARIPGIDVGSPPDLSIVTFRYRTEVEASDAVNQALLERINADGRLLLSSTRIEGRYTLRLAILNYATHLRDVDLALSLIGDAVSELKATTTETDLGL